MNGDHSWPNGLCPTGEVWIRRDDLGGFTLRTFDGFPHLRRDCATGQWIQIPGVVPHTATSCEVRRDEQGQIVGLKGRIEYRTPDPRIPTGRPNEVGSEHPDRVTKYQVQQSWDFTGSVFKDRLVLRREGIGPGTSGKTPARDLPLAETKNLFVASIELLIGDPARLRGYFQKLKEGKRIDLRFLEDDFRAHPHYLVGRGWQLVTYKSWTKVLYRAELLRGPSNQKNGLTISWLWLDEKGELQLGLAGLTNTLMPYIGFLSPFGEDSDNGRPWPVFVMPGRFVPAPQDGGRQS